MKRGYDTMIKLFVSSMPLVTVSGCVQKNTVQTNREVNSYERRITSKLLSGDRDL